MLPDQDASSTTAPEPRRSKRAAIAVLLALLAVLLWFEPPTAPVNVAPRSAPAQTFSAERALDWLTARGSLPPRPGGMAAHAEFRAALVRALEALGLEVEVQETLARGPSGRVAVIRNVVARQFPQVSGKAILVAAHYDSVGCSPGAADDASACASLLEVARALQHGAPLARPVVYLFSDAEEAGLIGAEAFASQHALASTLGCVINLEARGTFGPSVMFQGRGGADAIAALARAAPQARASSLADFIYKLMPNDTDYSVFAERGVHGFNFAFLGGLRHYHTPLDNLAFLDARSVQHQGEQVLALVRELSQSSFENWRDAAVVFTDLPGVGLLAWPPWLGVLLAVGAVVLAYRRRRGEPSALRAIAHVGPGVGAAAALAVCVVWCEFWALNWLLESPDAGARHDLAALSALHLACCGTFLLAAAAITRGRTFRETWLALGAAIAPLALGASLLLSDVSYLALLPALGWCVLEVSLAPDRSRSTWRLVLATALFASLALYVWRPLIDQFWMALSFRMPYALAVPSIAVFALVWPTFTLLTPGPLARAGAACLLASLMCLALLCGVDPRPADAAHGERSAQIEWLNLRHVDDTERGVARFEASTFGAALPHQLAQVLEWKPADTPPFPWMSLDRSMHVAAAPRIDAPAPELEVLESTQLPQGRRVRCRVRSARGAPRLHLHVPPEVAIEAIHWRGQRITEGLTGVHTQLLFAFESDGVEFELFDRGGRPSSVHLVDQDWATTAPLGELIRAREGTHFVPRSDGDIVIMGARRELR